MILRRAALVLMWSLSSAGCRRLLEVEQDPAAERVTPPPANPSPRAFERRALREAQRALARQQRHAPTARKIVQCRGQTLTLDAPSAWRELAPEGADVVARWALGEGSDGPWALVRCAAVARTGVAEIDALYQRFTSADGAPHPRLGTGYAAIGQRDGMRTVRVDAQGTLARSIPGVPLAAPAPGARARTSIVEASEAAFVFELVGAHGALDSWESAFDALVDSARGDGQAVAARSVGRAPRG